MRWLQWGAASNHLTTSTGAERLSALDGFRGIFVSLVILYHVGVTALVGGWVGINHFFVFSGYLIARILISERAKTGRIDLWRFYRRRAERLVPALVVLTGAVLVHTWLFAPSALKARYAGDVLATLGWVQNWRLADREEAYFDLVGDPSPLRHAWTLGVEEQFYVLVPVLVLLLFAWARGRRVMAAVVLALALGSAWWSAHLLAGGASFTRLYYGTDTRAQALLVGVLFAVLLGRGEDGRLGRRLPVGTVHLLGWVGAAVSIAAFVLVDPDSPWLFGDGGILLFAMGAGLMGLAAVDPRPMLLTRIASWRPIVVLGRMTYGIYLYHWPLHLWLAPHLSALPSWVSITIQFGLTVVLASLSFRWLEVPVLMGGFGALRPRLRPTWILPVAAVGTIAVGAIVVQRSPVDPVDLDVPALVATDAPAQSADPPRRVALIGDSVGVALGGGWRAQDHPGVTLGNLSRIGCDLIVAPQVQDGSTLPADSSCAAWRDSWAAAIRDQRATDVVVLGGLQFVGDHDVGGTLAPAGSPRAAALITDALDEVERHAGEAGVQRVFAVTVPCREVDPRKLDPRFQSFAPVASDPVRTAWVNATIRTWAAARPNRHLLDLWQPLCANGFTPTVHGIPLYHDTVHFTPAGAAMVWSWLTPRIVEVPGAS